MAQHGNKGYGGENGLGNIQTETALAQLSIKMTGSGLVRVRCVQMEPVIFVVRRVEE